MERESYADCRAVARSLPNGAWSSLFRDFLFRLGNELGDFGVGTYGLDERDQLGMEIHALWLLQFLAAFDENIIELLGFGICLRDSVIGNGLR